MKHTGITDGLGRTVIVEEAQSTFDAIYAPRGWVTATQTEADAYFGAPEPDDTLVTTAQLQAALAGFTPSGGSSVASPATAIGPTGTGLSGKGYVVPAGSLEVWRAARTASTASLCEVICFGDSLTRGEGPTAGLYSFGQRLREKSVAAGFPDGGRGFNNMYSTEIATPPDAYSGEPAPISAKTGFAAAGTWGPPNASFSTAANDTITFKVKATRARLFWARYTLGGRFSYTVNGGAAVTVNADAQTNPPRPASGVAGQNSETILLTSADGMTGGGATNTIVVTNLGGAPVQPPVVGGSGGYSTGSSLAAGVHYYWLTTQIGAGAESNVGPVVTITTTTGQKAYLQFTNPAGNTTRVYRSNTNNSTTAQLIGNTTTSGSLQFDDDGTATPGANPPNSANPPLNATLANVAVNVEAINDTGIVWHQQGASGTALADFFSVDDPFFNNDVALFSLGLQWGVTTPSANGITSGTNSDVLPSATNSGTTFPQDPAKARKPALVILAFGTNDAKMDRPTDQPGAPTTATAGVGNLAAATYYYKLKRVLPTSSLGPASPASAGTAASGSQQIAVTAALPAFVYGPPPIWKVYRATSSGGTYSYVGEMTGAGATFLDNVVTPGATMPTDVQYLGYGSRLIDTNGIIGSLGKAIQLIRNAGADPLVVLPSSENLALGGSNRGMNLMIKAAIKDGAEMFSCAWVDWDIALGPESLRSGLGYGNADGNPHLRKPAYQAEGDFLWNKILSL